MKQSSKYSLWILGVLLAGVVVVIIITSLYSASKSENQMPIEMVAFSMLTDEESALIPVSPKDSIVKKVFVNDDIKAAIEIGYTKDQVYSVTFNNTETDINGNLIVFVGLDKKTVLGKGYSSK